VLCDYAISPHCMIVALVICCTSRATRLIGCCHSFMFHVIMKCCYVGSTLRDLPTTSSSSASSCNTSMATTHSILHTAVESRESKGGNGSGVNRDGIMVDIQHACFDWNSDGHNLAPALAPASGNGTKRGDGGGVEMVFSKGSNTSESMASPRGLDNSNVDTPTGEMSCQHTLQDITLQIRRGELVAIVGGVGQGKSSLVSAILGHIHKVSGEQTLNAHVAFVSQEHWIQNSTLCSNVRINMLF
jgi:ABC-type multidrug transport system fused ATPase/permease subunit